MANIPGLTSGHQMITPACRSGRGVVEAFDEAAARLRATYSGYADSDANAEVTWHLVLVRDEPTGRPVPPHGSGP